MQTNINERSKNGCLVTFNEHKLQAPRKKCTASKINVSEPIYVNRLQNQTLNYNIKDHIHGIQNEHEHYDVMDNDDNTAFESVINASKVKSNYKLMGKPPSGEKHLRSFFGLSLDEREMPITRECSKLSQVNNQNRATDDTKKVHRSSGSPTLLRASTCDAYPSRTRNR